MRYIVVGTVVAALFVCHAAPAAVDLQGAGIGEPLRIDLAAQLAAGRLRGVNRDVTRLPGPGPADAVHVSARSNSGVVWIEGTDLALGTIDLDVRGKDVFQQSFLGIAFHRTDDNSYEAIYLRPFNFRPADAARRHHAVQYIALPGDDWPRLRQEFPEQFEGGVDASIDPAAWVALHIVVNMRTIQVRVGSAPMQALEARRLDAVDRGQIGLWVGNGSDGDFANLRVMPASPAAR